MYYEMHGIPTKWIEQLAGKRRYWTLLITFTFIVQSEEVQAYKLIELFLLKERIFYGLAPLIERIFRFISCEYHTYLTSTTPKKWYHKAISKMTN